MSARFNNHNIEALGGDCSLASLSKERRLLPLRESNQSVEELTIGMLAVVWWATAMW
jgi:hypothetical protein